VKKYESSSLNDFMTYMSLTMGSCPKVRLDLKSANRQAERETFCQGMTHTGLTSDSWRASARIEEDLKRFRDYVEERGGETGGWRGQVKKGNGYR
jgi:hypothetical protein